MRAVLFAGLATGLAMAANEAVSVAGQPPKEPAKSTVKDSPAAEFTRTKLLKVKVTAEFTDVRLGEVLKELAAQTEMQIDQPVIWAYGANFPFAKKVTFAVKDKPLEVALDSLLTQVGGGVGYVVVSKDGDKYDGWVKLTTTGERGFEPPPATAAEEAEADEKLALAKKLIDAGKPASAKPVLAIIARKFPTTKAGIEAKELLAKIEKDK